MSALAYAGYERWQPRDNIARYGGTIQAIRRHTQGTLRDRLSNGESRIVQKELQRGILSDAVARGEAVEGVSLVKGSHVRLR